MWTETSRFGVLSERNGNGIAAVCLEGELDMAVAPELRDTIDGALATGDDLILDLEQATFIDSSIIKVLFDSVRAAHTRDRSLVLQLGTAPIVERGRSPQSSRWSPVLTTARRPSSCSNAQPHRLAESRCPSGGQSVIRILTTDPPSPEATSTFDISPCMSGNPRPRDSLPSDSFQGPAFLTTTVTPPGSRDASTITGAAACCIAFPAASCVARITAALAPGSTSTSASQSASARRSKRR